MVPPVWTGATPGEEVVGVTSLVGVVGNVVVVVEVEVVVEVVVGVVVDDELGACRSACPPLDAAWVPWPLEWSDVAAATRAKRESVTARTAHQCGLLRGGRARPDAIFERSPATR
jgi:hypothetical protein